MSITFKPLSARGVQPSDSVIRSIVRVLLRHGLETTFRHTPPTLLNLATYQTGPRQIACRTETAGGYMAAFTQASGNGKTTLIEVMCGDKVSPPVTCFTPEVEVTA